MTNKQVFKQLTSHHSMPARLFGLTEKQVGANKWVFRRLITNILVGGSLEENVLKAQAAVFTVYPTVAKLAGANVETLSSILRNYNVRFAERKAGYVTDTAKIILKNHKGKVPADRALLEAMPGVGRHVASIVLALAFNKPAFAVDLHVKRIAKRLGLVADNATDLAIETALMKGIPPEQHGRYSRAFVDFGKSICSKVPDCKNCYLKKSCEYKPSVPVPSAKAAKVADGIYEIVAGSSDKPYTVQVTAGKTSCNCKGFHFRRTCSHVKAVLPA